MKRISIILISVMTLLNIHSQSVVHLNPILDATIYENKPTQNDGFNKLMYTGVDQNDKSRSLIQFDLSMIPTNATIVSADLHLFGAYHLVHNPYENDCRLFQNNSTIPAESLVDWSNAPMYDPHVWVPIQGTSSNPNSSDRIVSITNFVQNWVTNPANNFGLTMTLADENVGPDNVMTFYTKESLPTLTPELTVTYSVPTCTTIPITKDAFITTYYPNINYGNHTDFIAIRWTAGNIFTGRTLFEVDLSSIPAGQTIISAQLNLYGINSTSNQHHDIISPATSNAADIHNVTAAWNESTATWNNTQSIIGSLVASHGNSYNTDDWNINMTAIVNNWYTGQTQNFGLLLKMHSEVDKYQKVVFASSDYTVDPSKRPTMDVCYNIHIPRRAPINNQIVNDDNSVSFSIYPNPSTDIVNIDLIGYNLSNTKLEVFNIQGEVLEVKDANKNSFSINTNNYKAGIYYIRISDANNSHVKKLVIN